jgi:hypothetical protein
MKQLHLTIYALGLFFSSFAQQTVGLINYTTAASEGYTLFSPIRSKQTYLINNCGEKVHSWSSQYFPAMGAYLLENGVLLRTGNTGNTTFTAGGNGGIIEMFDWSGNVIWHYTTSSLTECFHHDIKYLPNGNILAIVWDLYRPNIANQAGRTIVGNSVWAEKIIEIEPNFISGGGTIVWEWKVWDHLIQDENPTSSNYGIIANEPGLIDLNYPGGAANTEEDWLHFNGIDYNETLDQIILSVHHFSEIWIIDHSTTTQEAKGRTGGNSGLGGDLLFRWGNPEVYDQGGTSDQRLYSQHHAHWIEDGLVDEGKIMVFNNRAGLEIGQDYSTVNIIEPIVDTSGNYEQVAGTYSPSDFYWTYSASTPTDFYSSIISGAHRLANGNTLITAGTSGKFFEIDNADSIVWEYINPVSLTIANQGDPAGNNSVFRATRYPSSYPGFVGVNLVPLGYIESGSTFICSLLSLGESMDNEPSSIFPNPAEDFFRIKSIVEINKIVIYNLSGDQVQEVHLNSMEAFIDCSDLTNGVYFVNSFLMDGQIQNTKLVIAK